MKFYSTLHSLLFLLLLSKFLSAQAPENLRYQSSVFEKVQRSKNLAYQTSAERKAGLFDFYEPKGDSATLRPLVIWLHGGGFKLGKKTSRGIPGWCRQFARRGYTCAAINYRQSKKKPLSNYPDLVEGCYEAIRDLQSAVSYLKKHAAHHRIDTNKIFLAGNSAGGMVALQAAYSQPVQLMALFDSTAVYAIQRQEVFISGVAGVISFWGALFDTAWLRQAKVPVVMVHGTDDRLVPFRKAETPMYGSFYIRQQAEALQIPHALKTYEGLRHELQKKFFPFLAFGAAHRRWEEAGAFAAYFLYKECLK